MILVLMLAFGLQAPPDRGRVSDDGAQEKRTSKQSQRPALVSTRAVSDFFRWAGERKQHEIVDVWKKAVAVFPRGSAIEGYPDSVGDPASRRSLSARFMVSKQLERDGVKVEDVEAVTLFVGDDGQVQRDVVLVVSKVARTIVGVYQAWHGR